MKSLRKAIDILELLKDSSRSHTIAELHEETNLPPSTIHRILNALAEKHFVTHDEATHTYQLGPALISLGVSAAKSFTLQDVARPILRELSAKIYEDSYLVVKVKDRGMVLLQQSGSNPLKVVEDFGANVTLEDGTAYTVPAGDVVIPRYTDMASFAAVELPDGRIGTVEVSFGQDGYPVYINGIIQDEYGEIHYAD